MFPASSIIVCFLFVPVCECMVILIIGLLTRFAFFSFSGSIKDVKTHITRIHTPRVIPLQVYNSFETCY